MTIRQVVFFQWEKDQLALGTLNRYLLILKRLIFESSVRAGSPSFVAAPDGPENCPQHSSSAVSMISFSCRAGTRLSVLTRLRACPNARGTGNLEKCIKVNWLIQ